MCSKVQGYYQTTEEIKMKLVAITETHLSTTNLYQLDNNQYMLSNSSKNLYLKLNYDGLPLEKPLNSLPVAHIKLVRWAQIQISSGKKNGTWITEEN